MPHALEAVAEIFTWAGLGMGALFAGVALVAFLFDGTWVPVRAVVERLDGRTLVRWFGDDDGVNEVELSEAQLHEIGPADWADIYVRQGWANRMRLHPRSAIVRGFSLLAGVLLGVGVLALVVSIVGLFVER